MQGKGLALLICLAALALLLGGCGGGGEQTSSAGTDATSPQRSTASSPPSTTQLPPEVQAKVKEAQERAVKERKEAQQSPEAQPPHIPHHDSGGGSAQFRHKGGDNSIPEFGQEASAPEREEAAEALHAYFDSIAAGRFDAACTYMSASLLAMVERLPQLSKQKSDLEGCPQILETVSSSPSERQAAAQADVGSLRVEGDRAFLLYRGAGGESYVMPMVREEGAWRVSSLGGTAGF